MASVRPITVHTRSGPVKLWPAGKNPERLRTARELNALYKRAREHAQVLKEGMPSQSQMLKPVEDDIQQNLRWERRNAKRQKAYQLCMQQVDPDNPEARMVERLRPTR